MEYDKLLKEAEGHLDVYEKPMQSRNKGLYHDGIVWINRDCTRIEKACILAEEMGHYHTTVGNILDLTNITNSKQELQARQWGYFRLLPLERIIEAYKANVKGRHEIAEYLEVTEEFLQAAVDRYRDKYGLYKQVDDRFIVYFEPALAVLEMFD